jgi:predicted ArsR family transcriptional regulator
MPKTTSRQKVQAYLKKQHSASAMQIGHALNMATPDVRHHLTILLADERIVMLGEIRSKRRGRPVKVYGSSGKALGDNLALLSSGLLDELLKKASDSKRQAAMHTLGVRLSDQIGRIDQNQPGTKRLATLVEKLNEHHYEARWEAGSEGPRILFARCPYAAIIEQHPELCQMDGFMLQEEANGQARQLAKINQKPGGNTHCIFLIK